MRDKIRLIMEGEKMTQQEFAQRLKISPASLSSIFTGRTNPTNTHVMAIHSAFPNINVNWLLFGEGSMYESEDNAANETLGTSQSTPSADCQNGSTAQLSSRQVSSPADAQVRHQPSFHQASHPQVYAPVHGVEMRRNDYEMVKIVDNKRKIKEIRVFYDDGTYESFAPSVK